MPKLNNDKADKGYERWKNTVLNFLQIKRSYERESKIFEARKKNFYAEADEFFETKGKQSAIEEREIFLTEELGAPTIVTVSRVTPVKVEYNADEIEKKLGKDFCEKNNLIEKHYEVKDINGLIEYLKSCGVKPSVFKGYLTINKKVIEKNIEQLYQTAKLSEKDVEGCYTVTKKSTYYSIKTKAKNS